MPEKLSAKQQRFARMAGELLSWVSTRQGWGVAMGEAHRPPETAAAYAAAGKGIANSLHTKKLALDLMLFIGGVYQTDSAAYLPLGEFWESIGGSWGGRFSRPDGNHFSLEHGGVR